MTDMNVMGMNELNVWLQYISWKQGKQTEKEIGDSIMKSFLSKKEVDDGS